MLKRALIASGLVIGLTFGTTGWAQDKKEPPPTPDKPKEAPKDPSKGATTQPSGAPEGMSPEEMQAAMAAMMPGPVHQKLAKLAGDWTVKSKLMMGADMPPDETDATAKITVVLDGRFLHEDYSGTMMGMPFRSTHVLGYNNGSKKYEGMWAYTGGTALMFLTNGASADEGKTIALEASFDNETGIKETMKVTYTITDDDHFKIVLAGGKMPDGSPGPTMEMSYMRKK